MSDPYVGEIKLVGFNFAPRGYATCEGQSLSISQNTALFALLGTTFGGDGRTTFNLPDLRGRVAVGQGSGPGLTPYIWGQVGGQENVTLLQAQMPQHIHTLNASDQPADKPVAAGNLLPSNTPRNPTLLYASTLTAPQGMNPSSIGSAGASQPHTNIQPYLGLYYIIALTGIFPSRN